MTSEQNIICEIRALKTELDSIQSKLTGIRFVIEDVQFHTLRIAERTKKIEGAVERLEIVVWALLALLVLWVLITWR